MLSVSFLFDSFSYLHFHSFRPDGGVLAYIHPLLFQDSNHVIDRTIPTYTPTSRFFSLSCHLSP